MRFVRFFAGVCRGRDELEWRS